MFESLQDVAVRSDLTVRQGSVANPDGVRSARIVLQSDPNTEPT